MNDLLLLAVLVLLIGASAAYSGSETGCYCLSRLRLDADAREGRWSARLVRRLVRDDMGLLVTILIGNNLMIELLTHLTEHELEGVAWIPDGARELVVALVLTPVVFFFGELLPKDLFHRRPNALMPVTAPLLLLSKVLFLPVALPLRGVSALVQRALSLEESALTKVLGREAVVELIEEGTRHGALTPHAERLARNALELKGQSVASVLVPWERVARLDASRPDEELRAAVAASVATRLPVVEPGGAVEAYVHQLDVLGAPGVPVLTHRRPLLTLPSDLSVDRALARLRIGGHRLALVTVGAKPLGIVSLKDLVEKISGDLADW